MDKGPLQACDIAILATLISVIWGRAGQGSERKAMRGLELFTQHNQGTANLACATALITHTLPESMKPPSSVMSLSTGGQPLPWRQMTPRRLRGLSMVFSWLLKSEEK